MPKLSPTIVVSSEPKSFYDQGWDARVRNEAYDPNATLDWRDGWQDCEDAPEEDRKLFSGPELTFNLKEI